MPEILTHIPRSDKPPATKAEVIRRRTLGQSKTQIAKELGVSRTTVQTIIVESQTEQSSKFSIEQTFARAGLTAESIASKFKQLQEAQDTRLASFEGKFTDRLDVPDGNVQFRATEATAKILGLFPKEDAAANAQLFVRLPDVVLTAGHKETCLCQECRDKWESLPVATPPTEP